ncbi:hypothetical protein, partial [Pseudomonas sp. TWR3-1-1]|uniref:hypothetical protein n=1 Tax=Pseudomonas sp. TWR3-1-1 TaxID=2804633 RepID=UPI003CE86886
FEDGCAIILSIDGVPAAHIISGEKANLGVAIGSHKLSARHEGECANQELLEIKLRLKAGDAIVVDFDKVFFPHIPL